MFFQSEFNPSIIFFLLWGLFSWLTKNKKQNSEPVEAKNLSSDNNDFYQVDDEFETLIFNQEVDDSFVEAEIEKIPPIPNVNNEILDLKVNENSKVELDIIRENIPVIEHKHWLLDSLSDKNKIKKALILNEVLNKPRSLNPY